MFTKIVESFEENAVVCCAKAADRSSNTKNALISVVNCAQNIITEL